MFMDEKREMLMKLLFGDGESGQAAAPALDAQMIERWQKANEKAQKINETLENSEKSASILREMMHRTGSADEG